MELGDILDQTGTTKYFAGGMNRKHPTLMDFFTAAGNAASPLIQEKTDELRRKNDLEARNISARAVTDFQDWTRDHPYNPPAGADLQTYTDEYAATLKNQEMQWYAENTPKNAAPYLRQAIAQQQTAAVESARNFTLEEADKWRMGKELVAADETIAGFKRAGWNAGLTMQAIKDQLDLLPLGPQQKHERYQAEAKSLFGQRVTAVADGVTAAAVQASGQTPEALVRERLAAVSDEFSKAMGVGMVLATDDAGNVIASAPQQWTFEGKDAAVEQVTAAAVERIQNEFGARIQEAQGWFTRLVVSGDIPGAIAFGTAKGNELNKYYDEKSAEYSRLNTDQRRQFDNYFDVARLKAYQQTGSGGGGGGGGRRGGGGKEDDIAALLGMDPKQILRPMRHEDGMVTINSDEEGNPVLYEFDTYKEAVNFYIDREKQVWDATHQDMDPTASALGWESRRNKALDEMMAEFKKQMPKQLAADFDDFQHFNTFLQKEVTRNGRKVPNEFFIGDYSGELGDMIAQGAVDFMWQAIYNGIDDPVSLRKAMREYTNVQTNRLLEFKEKPGLDGRLDALGEYYRGTRRYKGARDPSTEHLVFRNLKGEPTFRSPKQAEESMEAAQALRQTMAEKFELPLNSLHIGWAESENIDGDTIAEPVITVGQGERAQRFRADFDSNRGSFKTSVLKELLTLWRKPPLTNIFALQGIAVFFLSLFQN